MFGQLEELQNQLKAKLETITETTALEGGKLKIEINGNKQVVNVSIDPDLLTRDAEELEDLLVVGLNQALQAVEARAAEETSSMMSSILPPGMNMPF